MIWILRGMNGFKKVKGVVFKMADSLEKMVDGE
jgi:hypothetical protein